MNQMTICNLKGFVRNDKSSTSQQTDKCSDKLVKKINPDQDIFVRSWWRPNRADKRVCLIYFCQVTPYRYKLLHVC